MKTFGLNYDIQHNNRVELIARNVNQLYLNTIRDIVRLAEIYNIDVSKPFVFSEYPEINRQVDKLISNLSTGMKGTIDYGTKNEWIAACKKNDFLIESLAKSTGLKPESIAGYSNRNIEALQSFQTRKIGGLNLSEKVWKYATQFKGDIELGLDIGIGDGRSAAELSRDLRSYLQEPQKLFRRVADKHGVLRLSQNAKKYSPDTGVYRSSYKNAMRLTRTEVNMAYRTSDYERIQELDFVVGIEIRRSNHIFACPVCEALKGKYPKTFKFTGWHPQCRCHQISILATNDEFMNQQKALLDGNEIELKSKNEVSDVPDNFKQWIKDNHERIDNAKSKPFFINDNPKFINTKTEKSSFDYNGLVSKHGAKQIEVIDEKYKDKIVDIDKADIEDFLLLKRDTAIYEKDSAAIDYFNQRINEFNSSKNTKALINKEWTYTDDVLDKLENKGVIVYKEGITPFSYKQNLGDFNLEEFLTDIGGICSKNEIELNEVHLVNDLGRVKLSIYGSHKNVVWQPFTLEREFSRNNGILTVNHTRFELGKNIQGKGISKDVFSSLYNQYKNAGIEKINVHANMSVGGYTWGKYGFSVKKSDIDGFIVKTIHDDAIEKEMRIIVENYFKLNKNAETFPMNLFATEKYKKYMLGSDWNGSLDLTDEIQKAVFESYLKK